MLWGIIEENGDQDKEFAVVLNAIDLKLRYISGSCCLHSASIRTLVTLMISYNFLLAVR